MLRSRLFRAVLVLALAGGSAAAGAQTTYHGCTDAAGNPVAAVADPALDQLVASRPGPAPEIRYNEDLLPRLLPESRAFLFAHECARHNLGLPIDRERGPDDARQADCHALAAMVRSGLIDDTKIDALERDLQFDADEWAVVPGPRRPFTLRACAAEVATERLRVGPSSERPEWNGCVRGCGERLRACAPRGPACDDAYERCTAMCDFRSPP